MKQIAVARMVGLVVALGAAWLCIDGIAGFVRVRSEIAAAMSTRAMETPVDLSHPGEITVPFHQVCQICHGERILLLCEGAESAQVDPTALLTGLRLELIIRDAQGGQASRICLSGDDAYRSNGAILLGLLPPFPKGEYTAAIHVASGAPALAGKGQELVVEFFLCGLETQLALLSLVVAVFGGLLAALLLWLVLPGTLRYGIRRRPSSAETQASLPGDAVAGSDS